jgi:murein DD-endopeptidase MepM/ murein hydrolase activator NlpD
MPMKKVINFTIILLLFIFLSPGRGLSQNNEEIVNKEVKEINNEIKERKDEIKEIQEKQELYSRNIKARQSEQASLKNQIAILENRIAKAELDIEEVEIEINRVNLEIKKTDLEIEENNKNLLKEKEHIANVLKLMYKNSNSDTLKILLLNDSLVEFLNQTKYLEDINSELKEGLEKLKFISKKLDDNKLSLNESNKELISLKGELEQKKENLNSEIASKGYVIEQVRNSEKEYKNLLELAKQEQMQASLEIASLEKTVRQKIANLSGGSLEFNDSGMVWPVTKNVITASFHDPSYPFRHIFEHPAVDIRAKQGQVIKAAASGYVAMAKDAGMGYSYIMIIHGDGLSTVYGHTSKIYVKEDEYVVQGQTIGLVGGMPGTPGAGRLTTGPHLHFETRLNGIPVNPLEYLP